MKFYFTYILALLLRVEQQCEDVAIWDPKNRMKWLPIFLLIVSEQKTGLIYEPFYALVYRFWNRYDKIRVRFVFHCNIHNLTRPGPVKYFQINW